MFVVSLSPFGYTVAGNVPRLRRSGYLTEDFMISPYACLLIPISDARRLCAHSVGELMFSLSNVYPSTYQSLATLTTCLLEQCLYSSYAGNIYQDLTSWLFRDIPPPASGW
jgi:hypothetical protein